MLSASNIEGQFPAWNPQKFTVPSLESQFFAYAFIMWLESGGNFSMIEEACFH